MNTTNTAKRIITTRDICLISVFAALTAAGGWIKIPLPFSPVPFTLQTLFVFLAGLLLGSTRGALSQLIYVMVGLAGIPVFAGFSCGIGILLGPTGGYLIGFILGAYITGLLSERDTNPTILKNILYVIPGIITIYGLGAAWLGIMTDMSLVKAATVGILPFIPGGIIKIITSAILAERLKKAIVK